MIEEKDLKSAVSETLLNLAKEGVTAGKYTIKEAEELYKIKIPLGEIYMSKGDGFHFISRSGKKYPDNYGWSKYFIESNKFFHNESGKYIYDNDKKHYRRISTMEIDYMLSIDTNHTVHPSHRAGFLKTLDGEAFKKPDYLRPKKPMLNLKNGILDVINNKLLPHDSSIYFSYCLDHDYDPTARCDSWMKFLDDIFPNNKEYLCVCAMIFGYILLGGDPWLHKAFVLYGDGRNGKSTFLEILQTLIGKNNFSSVSLANLSKPFSVINIEGKLANISGETPSDTINAEIFKEATSGGLITGSKKYENEFDFKAEARFIFACNSLPKFAETTMGMHERLYFIPFTRFFEKSERRHDIAATLKTEISGILNWSLSGLQLLLDERRLPEVQATQDIMDEYKSESDSVHEWAAQSIEIDMTSPTIHYSRDLFSNYTSFAKDNGRISVGTKTFYKRFNLYIRSKGKLDDIYIKNKSQYKFINLKSHKNILNEGYKVQNQFWQKD